MAKSKSEAEEAKNRILAAQKNAKKAASKGLKKPRKRLSDLPADKKQHRFHAGTVALREIRKYQGAHKFATATLIPKCVVYQLMKQTLAMLGVHYKVKRLAFTDFHQALENEVVKQLQCANMAAIHAGHQGITGGDLEAAGLIRANNTARPIIDAGWAIKGKRARHRARLSRAKQPQQEVHEAGKRVRPPVPDAAPSDTTRRARKAPVKVAPPDDDASSTTDGDMACDESLLAV